MQSTAFPSIPIDTAKTARAIFGRSNFYLAIGDQADFLFTGLELHSPPKRMPKRICTAAIFYLITIFQFIETLPDYLAVDALRERIDWKYALHLPLDYPGMKAASLCEFRQWVLSEREASETLQMLLLRLSGFKDLPSKMSANLEAIAVIQAVCQFSRLASIWTTFSHAIEALAIRCPDWLLRVSLPHWYERYGGLNRNNHLDIADIENGNLIHSIGADGMYLLQVVSKANNPELGALSEIRALRQVWQEQFALIGESQIAWRKEACADCSLPGSRSYPIHFTNQDQ